MISLFPKPIFVCRSHADAATNSVALKTYMVLTCCKAFDQFGYHWQSFFTCHKVFVYFTVRRYKQLHALVTLRDPIGFFQSLDCHCCLQVNVCSEGLEIVGNHVQDHVWQHMGGNKPTCGLEIVKVALILYLVFFKAILFASRVNKF